ncbi:AAA family ATPase [Salsipaludibacter albus]|uniref:AAA family ATPase n=1 Tax=Salsipaludibacter albus TaxID=2849650 RepID=UPI001EE3EEB2|nr:P-loop NTPase [Salsipaludibacter albus]
MIHTFLVDPTDEARDAMARALGEDQPWVGHDSLPQLAQSIDEGSLPAIVLVGPGIVHDDTIMLSESVHDEHLPVEIIQFSKALDPDRLRDALRAGVSDVVEVGADDGEVRAAVARALRDLRAREAAPPVQAVASDELTPIVAVVAGKGGVGASLVATNLATALANSGVEVGLVDLDVRSGDLAIMLQKRPSLNLLDAVERAEHLDVDALEGYLTKVGDHLQLLAAPLEGGEVHVATTPFMHLLGMLADRVDVIVVDIGDAHDATGRAAMAEAREILVVTTREVTAIRGTRRVLADLEVVGTPRSSIRLVLNQSDASTGLGVPDLEKALNSSVDVNIPVDKAGSRSVNQGDPLVNRRRSKSGQALIALAGELEESLGLREE